MSLAYVLDVIRAHFAEFQSNEAGQLVYGYYGTKITMVFVEGEAHICVSKKKQFLINYQIAKGYLFV